MNKINDDNVVMNKFKKNFHIDHIIPLASGGTTPKGLLSQAPLDKTNDKNNLQILCAGCHFEKTRQEQDDKKRSFLSLISPRDIDLDVLPSEAWLNNPFGIVLPLSITAVYFLFVLLLFLIKIFII